MTEHPDQLFANEFQEADQKRLETFSCGSEEWSRFVTEWIRGSDALESRRKGTRIWLFENQQQVVVGFGSIAVVKWRWPPPDGDKTNLVLIPMLGLDERFRGLPTDPRWRYSRQIMSHLIAQAIEMNRLWSGDAESRPQWLILKVRQENVRAIRFYERVGFELIPEPVYRFNHVAMKLWIGE